MARNPYYSGPKSDHFDGIRFYPPGGNRPKTFGSVLRWQLGQRSRPAWPAHYPSPFAQQKPPARIDGGNLRVTFVGHATFLLQTRGLNILIDPVWSQRASPFRWAGPKRVNQPGIQLEDLPPLDAILLSHNHYDHMDIPTLGILARKNPCPVITPLGNDTILRCADSAIAASAYDWGARVTLTPEVSVVLTPAWHWSSRGLTDRCMALWSAFSIHTPEGAIYYAGDTALRDGSLFRDYFAQYGAPRLALLPVGAYAPRWFMADQHADPLESVTIMQLIEARLALGYHWGTFRLTDEPVDEPPQRLATALAQAGIAPECFVAQRPGAVTLLKGDMVCDPLS